MSIREEIETKFGKPIADAVQGKIADYYAAKNSRIFFKTYCAARIAFDNYLVAKTAKAVREAAKAAWAAAAKEKQ
jgi:hypothetical protein